MGRHLKKSARKFLSSVENKFVENQIGKGSPALCVSGLSEIVRIWSNVIMCGLFLWDFRLFSKADGL